MSTVAQPIVWVGYDGPPGNGWFSTPPTSASTVHAASLARSAAIAPALARLSLASPRCSISTRGVDSVPHAQNQAASPSLACAMETNCSRVG